MEFLAIIGDSLWCTLYENQFIILFKPESGVLFILFDSPTHMNMWKIRKSIGDELVVEG